MDEETEAIIKRVTELKYPEVVSEDERQRIKNLVNLWKSEKSSDGTALWDCMDVMHLPVAFGWNEKICRLNIKNITPL